MFYRFLLFVLLLFVITFYIMMDGLTHPSNVQSGSSSWDTGSVDWMMDTDDSANHPTITAYASANVTRQKRNNSNGSGSEDEFDEYGFGHSSVSASTLTHESETHEPSGTVYHEAFVFWVFVHFDGMTKTYYTNAIGDNNVFTTNYEGPYNERTSAYNSDGHLQHDTWYLLGKGHCRISNIKEELLNGENTSATALAVAP